MSFFVSTHPNVLVAGRRFRRQARQGFFPGRLIRSGEIIGFPGALVVFRKSPAAGQAGREMD